MQRDMKLSEVKERPSSLPTRPSVCRNSPDLGGSEILMRFSGIIRWRHCLHQDDPSLHTGKHTHTRVHAEKKEKKTLIVEVSDRNHRQKPSTPL